MASSSSSAEPRSIVSAKQYDVFISHRGPDVKHTLAKQLYDLLKARRLRAFLDREEIEGGDSIPAAIRNGIHSSLVQIAIFSKGFAESSWCLAELVLMLDQTDALFIPLFYGVQPRELRHIHNNDKSQYAKSFADYQSNGRYLDKLDRWKKALADAADISGYELDDNNQVESMEKVVSRVVQAMQKRVPLPVAKYPVGLDELVQDFERCCSKAKYLKTVGIFGLGGCGKTTLATELFNRKRSAYNASSFLFDVRETIDRGQSHSLQRQLLKDLFSIDEDITSVRHGMGNVHDRLRRAMDLRFLIVLDDISHEDQLYALLGVLGRGSLVIITTRDQSVLRGVDVKYEMKGMARRHAQELFCSHAFRRPDPLTSVDVRYQKLVESFVDFCGGLPLSLIVLGAHVYERDEYYWNLELEKVKKIPPADIMDRLKISFDGLDTEEKQIFIDIACLFNKKIDLLYNTRNKAITIWKACGWSGEHALQTLQDKCLIKMSPHLLEMHDHLRDLGRKMADEIGPPRLWQPELLRSMEVKGLKQILAELTKGHRCFHSFQDSLLGRKITYFIAGTDLVFLQIEDGDKKLYNIPWWIPLSKLRYLIINGVENLWSTFETLRQLRAKQENLRAKQEWLRGLRAKQEQLEFLQLKLRLQGLSKFFERDLELRRLRRLRPEHEKRLAELRAEQEQLCAEQERQHAEQEQLCAEQERQHEQLEFHKLQSHSKFLKRDLELRRVCTEQEKLPAELQFLKLRLAELRAEQEQLQLAELRAELRAQQELLLAELRAKQGLFAELRAEQQQLQLAEQQFLRLRFAELSAEQEQLQLAELRAKQEQLQLAELRAEQELLAELCAEQQQLQLAELPAEQQQLQLAELRAEQQQLQLAKQQQLQLAELRAEQELRLSQLNERQCTFELRSLRILNSPTLDGLPNIIKNLSQLEELEIVHSLEKTYTPSLVQSLEQLSNLRSLSLGETEAGFLPYNLNLSKGGDCSTSRGMDSLESIKLVSLQNIFKLVISEEMCPILQRLEITSMHNLKKMELKSLLAGYRSLEEISITGCPELESVQGVEELPGLKSLVIELNAWARHYIGGLRSLSAKKTIFLQKAIEAKASLKSNLSLLFSDVIDAQPFTGVFMNEDEVKRGEYSLKMESSSSAITLYALLVTSHPFLKIDNCWMSGNDDWLIIVVLTQHNSEACLGLNTKINKGVKVTLKSGEEGKALIILQRIVDQLW